MAVTERSRAALNEFARHNPCPSSGVPRYSHCVGYVVDHIIPLCLGGEDAPSNMQWQTIAAAKEKDVTEKRDCACFRKTGRACENKK